MTLTKDSAFQDSQAQNRAADDAFLSGRNASLQAQIDLVRSASQETSPSVKQLQRKVAAVPPQKSDQDGDC
jgi:hypothetical protein